MFNISDNWPDGLILWLFGIIAIALATDSLSLIYFSILVSTLTIVLHTKILYILYQEVSYEGIFNYNFSLMRSPVLLIAMSIINFIIGLLMKRKLPPELKDIY